jgi:hypothetical protein
VPRHDQAGFRIILHGQEDELWPFVSACRQEWKTLSLLEIAAPAALSNYTTAAPGPQAPISVAAAIAYNNQLDAKGLTGRYDKIHDGAAMKYLLLHQPHPVQAAAIGFVSVLPMEFGLDSYVDRDAQFDLCFRQPLNRALCLIGWRDRKRRTLGVLAHCS